MNIKRGGAKTLLASALFLLFAFSAARFSFFYRLLHGQNQKLNFGVSRVARRPSAARASGRLFPIVEELEKKLRKNPGSIPLLKEYADALYFHGETNKALNEYRKALSLYPDDSMRDYIHALMGEIFQEQEDFEKAMNEFEKASDFYLQGNLQEMLGHMDEAKLLYKKELDAHPDHVLAQKELFRLEHEEESPERLIQWMFDAPAAVSFSGTQVSTSFWEKHSQTIVAKVVHEAPAVYHVEYISPKSLRGHVLVNEGVQFFHYKPFEQTWVQEFPPEDDEEGSVFEPDEDEINTPLILKNFFLRMLPDERVAGRKCLVMQLLPKHKSLPRKTLWLDKAHGIVLKWEKRDAESRPVLLSEFTQIRFLPARDSRKNTGAVKKKSRRNNPPPPVMDEIVSVFRMKESVPATLALGFKLQNAKMTSGSAKQKTAHIDYSDGMNAVSFFIQKTGKISERSGVKIVKFKNTKARFYSKPHANLLTWAAEDKTFTLVSGIPQDCMISLFKSLSSLQ